MHYEILEKGAIKSYVNAGYNAIYGVLYYIIKGFQNKCQNYAPLVYIFYHFCFLTNGKFMKI